MLAVMQSAISHHQAGRLDAAESLYQQVLRAEPNHADAIHLFGVLLHQRGRHAEALDLIRRAADLNPGQAAYHVNLADVRRALGDFAGAEADCREALRFQPANADAAYNLGLVLEAVGRSDEALAQYESAMAARFGWTAPYLNAGNFLRSTGRLYEAAAYYREAVRVCGDAPMVRYQLGQLLLELGLHDEALIHATEAARLRPDRPEALSGLGDAFTAVGRHDEALAVYRQAVRLAPGLASTHSQMGRLLTGIGQRAEALVCFAEASRCDPVAAEPHVFAAATLYELGHVAEAADRYREAIRLGPDDARTHNSLGYVLQDAGDLIAAAAAYREAIRLDPAGSADARLNLGLLLTESGDPTGAIESFRASLQLDPYHPEALSALGMTLRDKIDPAEVAAAEVALARGRLTPERQATLEYGLAQVMDARGDYARAAALVADANGIFTGLARRTGQEYTPAEHHDYVDQIIRSYPAEHFARVRGWGLDTDVPVFVLGLPRSGTSLVEQILASHPRVFGAGELNDVRDLYRSLPNLTRKSAPGVECVADLTRDGVESLARRYIDRVRGLAPEAARVVDKMPDNYLMIGLIATLFPTARIIHTRRDVRDTGLSCWLTNFKHIRWAADQVAIGERVREYVRLMDHWRTVLPGRMLEVDYEQIVADLEANARRLLAWCGLEWEPACLAFHQTRRVVRTSSMVQVREPLYSRSVRRWERYREFIGPLLATIGEVIDRENDQ
ncbi:tetratricopeptide repeat-containing sulfotransferase family protein [Fimbriiglobus ruber]|uniref:TPR repeat protein n=1 Tax=Fimbriiglobus ruber TaxID=1908690 RepID=A0A225DRY1_9BACT|nr:tetratricopeptide repeat-containing sulfotransferase family protein [Fimbriiglobus ruber]OWK39909.1 TPR repeat protein [Fimbriiglobus ruber]